MQALEVLEKIVHPGSEKLDVRQQSAVSVPFLLLLCKLVISFFSC